MSRRHGALRFNILNGLALCPACHRLAHEHPDAFRKWAAEEIGPENMELLEQAKNWDELDLAQMSDLINLYRSSI
jgi:hypothetical protein